MDSVPAQDQGERLQADILESRELTEQVRALCRNEDTGFRSISDLSVDLFKTHDTVYILGSGQSINHIPGGVEVLRDTGDVIGLNYSLLLDVIPNVFFVHEPWLQAEELQRYFRLLQYRYGDHPELPLIYDVRQALMAGVPLSAYPSALRGQTFLNAPSHFPATDTEFLCSALQSVQEQGLLTRTDFSFLLHHMSTMALAVSFAAVAGYKNIVLLGVDLKDMTYFFDEIRPRVPDDLMPQIKREKANRHSTADKTFFLRDRSVPIDEFLYAFQEHVLNGFGAQLYSGSKESLLYPNLPYWFENI